MMGDTIQFRLSSPWVFFALALGSAYLLWVPLAPLGWHVTDPRALALFIAEGAAVPLGGVFLTYLTRGPAGSRDYWRRAIDFKRIGFRWLLVILLIVPTWATLGIVTGFLAGEGPPSFETPLDLLANPARLLPFAFFILLYGPVPEELGWRGYALDRLQERYSALTSSLILGGFWVAWHIPQFFIPGLLIGQVFPIGSTNFWVAFVASLPAQSVLYTWIYNNTSRSTLSAILFHFMTNFTGEFMEVGDHRRLYGSAWTVFLAVVVVIVWGPRTLRIGGVSQDNC